MIWYNLPMISASKSTVKTDGCSQLEAVQLLAILQQKEAELEQRNVELESKNVELETKNVELESKDTLIAHLNEQLAQIIADRNIYKTLSDELLRLGKVQQRGKVTANYFIEPQWSLASRGDGQPEFQLYAAVNLQFR